MGTSQGFTIRFGTPNITPEFEQPDIGLWTKVMGNSSTGWCYGELLSYHTDDTTENCLKQALLDWDQNRLDTPRLNGRFVLIFRRDGSHEWTIITDRVGAMHAYITRRGERIVEIGSDLASLDSEHHLDWVGINSFFTFGFFMEDRTYFADTKILFPHFIYCISDDGQVITSQSYWAWHQSVDPKLSYSDAVVEYDRLLRQAVRRACNHGQVILPISGGLDSRSLAAVLPEQIQTYSYGYTEDSVETRIASQVASAQGLKFTQHVIHPYLFERLNEIVRALHGSQDVTQARQCSVNGWVREQGDVVLTGLWGDLICNQIGLADGLPERMSIVEYSLRKIHKRGRAWLQDNISRHHLGSKDPMVEIVTMVEKGIGSFSDIEDIDFRVKAFKTSTWVFRWSNSSLRGFALGATPRIPYYDVDLIDFFCTVPTAFVRDRRLQIDHLKRYAPHLARVEWQSAGANLYWAQYGKWISFPRRVINRVKRTLKQEKSIQRNWEVQFLSPERRQKLTSTLMTLCPDFVQQDALQKLIDQFYQNPDAANGYTVSMLVTLAGWMAASQLI